MDVASQPGTTNPEPSQTDISLAGVVEGLRLCTMGKDPVSVMAGDKILQSYQSHRQYLTVLGTVICDDARPDDVRTIAAILFRNNTEKFWRQGPLQLDEPTKQAIRGNIFLACFRQQNPVVSASFVACGGELLYLLLFNQSVNQSIQKVNVNLASRLSIDQPIGRVCCYVYTALQLRLRPSV